MESWEWGVLISLYVVGLGLTLISGKGFPLEKPAPNSPTEVKLSDETKSKPPVEVARAENI